MQVETYEVLSVDTDAEGRPYNETVSEEAMAIIEAMGLAGQKKLLNVKKLGEDEEGEEVVTRMPYRLATLEELRVFKALFPKEDKFAEYSAGPIPLKVLQIAAHAKTLGMELVVWRPLDMRDTDPVLIGIMKGATYSWVKERYLLARWGDALVSLEELSAKAKAVITRRIVAEVADLKRQVELAGDAETIGAHVAHWLTGTDKTDGAWPLRHVAFATTTDGF